jgi:hypothetical protein
MDERASLLGMEFIGLRVFDLASGFLKFLDLASGVLDLAMGFIDLFVGLYIFEYFLLERFHLEFFGFLINLEQRVHGFFIEAIGREASEIEQRVGGFSGISIC